ncbi:hypothetical protein VTG60DRAFT_4203 [Thermothelomyces hinnuleus]
MSHQEAQLMNLGVVARLGVSQNDGTVRSRKSRLVTLPSAKSRHPQPLSRAVFAHAPPFLTPFPTLARAGHRSLGYSPRTLAVSRAVHLTNDGSEHRPSRRMSGAHGNRPAPREKLAAGTICDPGSDRRRVDYASAPSTRLHAAHPRGYLSSALML